VRAVVPLLRLVEDLGCFTNHLDRLGDLETRRERADVVQIEVVELLEDLDRGLEVAWQPIAQRAFFGLRIQ
jgi:hypothetical protein